PSSPENTHLKPMIELKGPAPDALIKPPAFLGALPQTPSPRPRDVPLTFSRHIAQACADALENVVLRILHERDGS
ncbi:MAG: hypothetical protein QOI13_1480, partial [Paraburkholderia sp.]|nr:hypothetical protein [Paraburkholderia sp.]